SSPSSTTWRSSSRPRAVSSLTMRGRTAAHAVALLLASAIYLGNIAALVWIWVDNGNLTMHTTADLLARTAGLAGLIGAYLALVPGAARYWRILALVALATLAWRVLAPLVSALRHRLKVVEVIAEGPGATSLRIAGRKLDRLHAVPGQFFIWRFLAAGHWWSAHPFSLSAAPDGATFRITAKSVGDHTYRMRTIPVGTRVVTEGPFGDFTERSRRREKVLLVAGGIG